MRRVWLPAQNSKLQFGVPFRMRRRRALQATVGRVGVSTAVVPIALSVRPVRYCRASCCMSRSGSVSQAPW